MQSRVFCPRAFGLQKFHNVSSEILEQRNPVRPGSELTNLERDLLDGSYGQICAIEQVRL